MLMIPSQNSCTIGKTRLVPRSSTEGCRGLPAGGWGCPQNYPTISSHVVYPAHSYSPNAGVKFALETHSTSDALFSTSPGGFAWATGIEDTFIGQTERIGERVLDEYALTHHYLYWREDIDRAAALGVRAMRYGIP